MRSRARRVAEEARRAPTRPPGEITVVSSSLSQDKLIISVFFFYKENLITDYTSRVRDSGLCSKSLLKRLLWWLFWRILSLWRLRMAYIMIKASLRKLRTLPHKKSTFYEPRRNLKSIKLKIDICEELKWLAAAKLRKIPRLLQTSAQARIYRDISKNHNFFFLHFVIFTK